MKPRPYNLPLSLTSPEPEGRGLRTMAGNYAGGAERDGTWHWCGVPGGGTYRRISEDACAHCSPEGLAAYYYNAARNLALDARRKAHRYSREWGTGGEAAPSPVGFKNVYF